MNKLSKTTKILITIIGIQQRFAVLCHPVTDLQVSKLLTMCCLEHDCGELHWEDYLHQEVRQTM
jgi:hypothetical protein